ncbi:MAG: phenylacetate--CoA ligase [Phaeodactylibacter sp.]|nr:phenylacetate--CoA ligase [Phaeodactylibacter sp.]MCB9273656.1 phenylacetate--CoA ligase [Lewinellaceae bacterium]
MRYFNPDIETMPLSRLRQLQSERLRNLTAYLYERVPFYRKQLDEAGIRPSDIKGVESLHKLPFTRKFHLRDYYPFGLFAVPQQEVIRIHASSGTTGKPTVVGYTRQDIAVFSEVVARSLVAAGCQPGMKLQNAYGYGLFTGGLGLHYGAELLGMAVIPVSGGMTDRQLMLLQDFQPEAIACTPSYAQTLAEQLGHRGIGLDKLNLRTAILGAEPWTEAVRQQVEIGLGVNAINIYGLSEIIGPGVSNEDFEEKGTGSYIWEDHFFPEIVDKDTGEPVPEGAYGVLVFTTLTKQAMPLLRYWTNDITNIYYEHSEKRTHIKMGTILGRADDMLIIRGVNLFHTQVEAVISFFGQLSPSYQLIVSREGAMDGVEVKVELEPVFYRQLVLSGPWTEASANNPALYALHHELTKKIKDNIGLSMKITLCEPGSIPRSEGGKLSRVVDLRK